MNISQEDLGTILNALEDASYYREPDDYTCNDCEYFRSQVEGARCEDHRSDAEAQLAFINLRDKLMRESTS